MVLYDVFREHVEKINAEGLAIEDAATGEVLVAHPAASTRSPGRGRLRRVHRLREVYTHRAGVRAIRAACRKTTVALTLQNGLGNEEIIRRHFGARANGGWGHLAGGDVPGARAHTPRRQGTDAPRHGGRQEREARGPRAGA